MPTAPVDPLAQLARRVVATAGAPMDPEDLRPTAIDGLAVVGSRSTTPITATLYRPVVCLILQGAKEVELGADRVTCAAGQAIIVSHDVPIQSQITVASPHEPYLALILDIDVALLRRLADDVEVIDLDTADPRTVALDVGTADDALIDAFTRLAALGDRPVEAPVLAPLIVHEIHFRLLLADHGAVLRQLLRRESHASRISKAIGRIRDDLAEPLLVPELAKSAGMSPSSFHEHFKSVTATTPIQYQKELRLLEARRLLGAGGHTVTEAALAVGYQSPTQFSREYSRKFGAPPSADRGRLVDAG